MAKLCQEAVDLHKERNDLILHWIQAIGDEQHAGFDNPTDEDNGLSRLNQRARERKERAARRNVETQWRVLDDWRYSLECQIDNLKELRAHVGFEEEFHAYVDQQQYSIETFLGWATFEDLSTNILENMIPQDTATEKPSSRTCFVCWESLPPGTRGGPFEKETELVWCPDCKTCTHRTCLVDWRREHPGLDCPICRPSQE